MTYLPELSDDYWEQFPDEDDEVEEFLEEIEERDYDQ
jgi:hypothetical protein